MVESRNELGEGVFFDKNSGALFWLDINQSILFALLDGKVDEHRIANNPSVVLFVNDKKIITLADSKGIIGYCLITKNVSRISTTPIRYNFGSHRANDGIRLDDDLYMYGVIGKYQKKGNGALLLSKNGESKVLHEGIGIPNTFIKIPNSNSILITDSFEKKTFIFNFDSLWSKVISKKLWLDLSNTKKTPDGGCISSSGRVFIAIWDGFEVLEFDLYGNQVDKFELPVPRPTSCCLNSKEDTMYVTSAYEGLSVDERQKYPFSGCLFTIDL